jgi:hypothetical protein
MTPAAPWLLTADPGTTELASRNALMSSLAEN